MKLGQCTYADYHNLRFSSTNVWILREISHIQEAINIYAVCREFYTKRIKDIFIHEFVEQKMSYLCSKKELYSKSVWEYPCCYNFFLSGLLDCSLFCRSCKVVLCSMPNFNLKKVCLI